MITFLGLKLTNPLATPKSRARWFVNRNSARGWFSHDERRILRAIWGCSSDEWVTLPGPVEWWPDVKGDGSRSDRAAIKWYEKHGFGLPKFDAQAYRTAAYLLFKDKSFSPPANWQEHMVHADGELAWDFDQLDLSSMGSG